MKATEEKTGASGSSRGLIERIMTNQATLLQFPTPATSIVEGQVRGSRPNSICQRASCRQRNLHSADIRFAKRRTRFFQRDGASEGGLTLASGRRRD